MSFLEDIRGSIDRLAVFGELDVDATALPSSATGLSDSSVREAIAETAGIIKQATMLQAVLAGVAASRSGRDRGHGGLVQESGHRDAVEFLRDVAGATRGEAIRAVKVGESLLDGASPGDGQSGSMAADAARDATPWHQPLRDALLAGTITTAQHHAIRAGLGAPPALEGRDDDTVAEVWRAAAHRLAEEARACTVEDLAARARALRDMIDPAGAEERYAAQFDKRSYRSSVDADGLRRGYIVFDPEMGVWLDDLMSAALRPRRGGPRFVADDQKRVADELENDPRTNDQLAYDLLIDVLRAGALTNAKDVYGAREPGIRLVTLKDAVTGSTAHRDAFGRLVAIACTYDGKLAIPGSVLERTMCFTGTTDVLTDTSGNSLDVGRELRLFSAKQRLTLALRDGGCLWPGCDRPPEYCEAHHCDHWADGGKTDCDRGVLLCRYHHLHLHNAGWRITRDGMGPFLLHPPASTGDAPIVLQSKSPLRWLWDPPPERARWRSAA